MLANQIVITPSALKQAKKIRLSEEKYHNLDLRVYIDGKGCDGFYYGVSFDSRTETDICIKFEGLNVIVDPDTLLLIRGAKLEWVDDERGKGFLVNNPNHKKFRGKFYKYPSFEKYWKSQRKI